MSSNLARHNRPVSTYLHPRVYEAIAGLFALFALAAWICFATTGGYAAYAVFVVTGLFVVAIAIPVLIWRTWVRNRPANELTARADEEHAESFQDWASSTFATWDDRLSGYDAATLTLLPIAAVAFGMVAIGAVFWIVSASVA